MKYHGFSIGLTPVEENGYCTLTITAHVSDGKECTILGEIFRTFIPLDDAHLVAEDVDTWIGDKMSYLTLAFTREMMFSRARGQGALEPKPVTRKKNLRSAYKDTPQ